MQCKCGGWVKDHKIERHNVIAGEFQSCGDCGRVHWLMNAKRK